MSGINYEKLKTKMKLSIQRLKLVEKKMIENGKKNTKEVADYLKINKYERARIRVEQIIREDYKVEAMEMVECYLDLLLARFGLLQITKEIEPDLEECISSILWSIPRLESDCTELKYVGEQFSKKYGKEYTNSCRSGHINKINRRLMEKLNEQPPSDTLIEKYLTEIALHHRVPFNPNLKIVLNDPDFFYERKEYVESNQSSKIIDEKSKLKQSDVLPSEQTHDVKDSIDDLTIRIENLRKNL